MTRISIRLAALMAICTAFLGADPMSRLPLSFEPNQGQHDPAILFSSRIGDGQLSLSKTDVAFWDSRGVALGMRIEGASPEARITGADPLPGRVNYFLLNDPSRWRTQIPTYARVRYEQIYPGIDLVFYSSQSGRLEYDFVVAPGADPSRIRLRLETRNGVRVTAGSDLVAKTEAGEFLHEAPVVYQSRGGRRTAIDGRYKLEGDLLRFEVGGYDAGRTLVIDPVVVFSSYLGGSGDEEGRGIALDSEGNIYLTGGTASANFPTRNALQPNRADTQSDVYVTKLNPDGSALIFSTYIGGASGDQGRSIAVGTDGAVYVGGNAGSAFPVTPGSFQTQPGLQGDAFLLKLNPAGSQLAYATLLAGARSDVVTAVAVDEDGNLFATGHTASDNFPVTPGAAQAVRPRMANSNDAFVLKLNPAGSALVYSTLVGGSEDDEGRAIALRDGSAYITGATESTDLRTTPGVAQPSLKGTNDGFVAQVNPAGSAFTFATYLGGTNVDEGLGIAVDVFGEVYVTGTTLATDFPTTPGAFQPQRVFNDDGFAAKLTANGSALAYSTYIGGSNGEHLNSIAVDRHGAAYIVGQSQGSYPVTAQALQPQDGGSSDLVLTKVSWDGRRLLYSSFLGGSGAERTGQDSGDGGGNTIALGNCMAYITGRTTSTNFPTTTAFQAVAGGEDDTIFAKIDPTADLGEPQIGCAAGFLSPLRPLVDEWTPRSIATLFGINFSASTGGSPEVGPDGLITTNLANTCIEIDGRRAPVYFVNGTQLNFQVPVETSPGWVRVFVISDCDRPNAARSEPLFVRIKPALPEFFIFPLNDPAIAAVNDTETANTGATAIVGPASAGAPYVPAKPGDIVSAYFTAGGATNPPLGTGQIPGGVFRVDNPYTVRLGPVAVRCRKCFMWVGRRVARAWTSSRSACQPACLRATTN